MWAWEQRNEPCCCWAELSAGTFKCWHGGSHIASASDITNNLNTQTHSHTHTIAISVLALLSQNISNNNFRVFFTLSVAMCFNSCCQQHRPPVSANDTRSAGEEGGARWARSRWRRRFPSSSLCKWWKSFPWQTLGFVSRFCFPASLPPSSIIHLHPPPQPQPPPTHTPYAPSHRPRRVCNGAGWWSVRAFEAAADFPSVARWRSTRAGSCQPETSKTSYWHSTAETFN